MIVLHLSPTNGSHTCWERPFFVLQSVDHVPLDGPQMYGTSDRSGLPSPSRSPTTHLNVMLIVAGSNHGALSRVTRRAFAAAIAPCVESWAGRSLAPASAPKSTAFCSTCRSWNKRDRSIVNATAPNRTTMRNADITMMTPDSSWARPRIRRSMALTGYTPSNRVSDCECRFMSLPSPTMLGSGVM